MAHDSDPFARWEAGQQLTSKLILGMVEDRRIGQPMVVPDGFVNAVRRTLDDQRLDRALIADAATLPSIAYLGELMSEIDIDGLWAAREHLKKTLAKRLSDRFAALYEANRLTGGYRYEAEAVGRRSLRNLSLHYLSTEEGRDARRRAALHFETAANMTDSIAGLSVLTELGGIEGETALARFHDRWKKEALVLDKWFQIQAAAPSADALERVRKLTQHPSYDARNPNRIRSLVLAFTNGNPVRFHDASGGGYKFLADQVIANDKFNPQIAARLVGPLGRWRRYDKARQALMKSELERIAAEPGLSRDVFEIASKSLA